MTTEQDKPATHVAVPILLARQLLAILTNNPYQAMYVQQIEACQRVHIAPAVEPQKESADGDTHKA